MQEFANSTASLYTVRIVPSTGTETAPYASSTPFIKASPRSFTSALSAPRKPFAIPAKILDRITPEFPRAPRSIPFAAEDETASRVASPVLPRAANPESIVIDILSPVSPSGIGKTLSSFTICLLFERFCAPPFIILANSTPLNFDVSINTSPKKYIISQVYIIIYSNVKRKYNFN